MTRKTKKLMELFCEKILADNEGVVREDDFRWGCAVGIRAFERTVWHERKDNPTRRDEIVVIADRTGLMFDNNISHMQEHHRWAYLRDLLPDVESPVAPRGREYAPDGSMNMYNQNNEQHEESI